jgi:hypothetical protein
VVYLALGLVALLGFADLALDIAHMVSVKRELFKAAEAGALSGARGLWPVTLPTLSGSRDPDPSTGQTWALNAATKNKVDGTNLATTEVTVEVGRWDYTTKKFTPGANSSANGVRVTTRRNNVQMILAQVLGMTPRNMSASAIAVMDFAEAVGKEPPIAINRMYTDPARRSLSTLLRIRWITAVGLPTPPIRPAPKPLRIILKMLRVLP